MQKVLVVLALVVGVGCSKAGAQEKPAPAADNSGVSKEAAEMIAQTHRDTCAATREARVELARIQAHEWLDFLKTADKPKTRTPEQAAFKARMPDGGTWKQWPLSSYPDGLGSVDQCHDEDAKVGLNTTPELGDVPAVVALIKWRAPAPSGKP